MTIMLRLESHMFRTTISHKKSILRCLLFFLLTGCACVSFAQDLVPIWPAGKMPNSKGLVMKDSIVDERIYSIAAPRLRVFLPSIQENKGTAVILCPGGGYARIAYMGAGVQMAKWFNTMGVAAFVLDYRLPSSPDLRKRDIGPLQDAQRAIRLVRSHAREWGIKSDKIGIMGTSAGGHIVSTVGTHFDDVSSIGDSLDRVSFTPNFMIMVSPVITMGTFAHAGSRRNLLGENPSEEMVKLYSNELRVTNATPPSFLVHAFNDKSVPVQNSLMFYQALVENAVPSSLHVFPQGGHAIALRNNPGSTESWTTLCEQWMIEMGFLVASVGK
jgi:acetyl esterase/lipase